MAVAPLSQPGGGAADLSAMLGQLDLGSEEGEDGLMKMMQGMMATLLSRDVLYPSLTDLCKQVHCYSKVVVHMLVQLFCVLSPSIPSQCRLTLLCNLAL